MTKIEYREKIENLIINRIKYHAPNLINDNVDYSLLDAVGIDVTLPIFIYKKPLNKLFFKAFYNVKKRIDFNLILTTKPQISERKLNSLKNSFVILEDEIGSTLQRILEALNINYISHSDFINKLEDECIIFNGNKIDFDYKPYYFDKKIVQEGVILHAQNYILNGKNFLLSFTNTKKQIQSTSFEINIPLPRGYYVFNKSKNYIEIENLTTKQKAYFNYNLKNAEIYFSNMNGIESCTFACIHLIGKLELLPLQNKKCYFNFGENKYCLNTPSEMKYFFEISQNKMNEIFDIKVTSHDKQFDQLFNFSLPRNIWEMWQKWGVDEKSENDWLKMKNQIIKKCDNGLQINENFKGLKEVKIFRNLGWKRVFIVHKNARYMYVDKIKYFNYTLLTKEIFTKDNESCLSFADS